MATRSITLRKSLTDTYVEGRTQGWLLRLRVLSAVDVDTHIFVFQRTVNDNGVTTDTFSNIASPHDLTAYAVDEPAEGDVFFRKDRADLVFRSLTLGRETLANIEIDVASLIEALNLLDTLQARTITIRHPSVAESSSSSSSSSSEPYWEVVLSLSAAEEYTASGGVSGYRICIAVVSTVGVPEEIFVMNKNIDTSASDVFANAASPADIEEYGVGAPYEGDFYYRVSAIELVFRSLTLAVKSLTDIQNDIATLLETYGFFANMSETVVVIS